ncbi:MAG: response regulator transcription factor [Bacteroidales bacterium]|nr:response regulator transcription factor [Bacteroidales bacterium]
MENNKTRCLIIDDEPLAIKLIRTHLTRLDSFEVTGECRNALKAIELLQKQKIDLMFLDINMPEISGIDFLKSVPNPPYVIITTAHREYAIEGYDLDVVDFLLKPVSFERFLKAINRFCSRTRKTSEASANENQNRKCLHLQDGKNTFRVPYDEISCIEGFGEYVKVITQNKTYVIRDTMSEYEERLPQELFVRIHKSYIINLSKVKGFNSTGVMLEKRELPIGRLYHEKALKALRGDRSL